MRLKKWLSYLFPQREKIYHSPISGKLEINWLQGRKVLDTATSNYSYGSLQRILHKGLQEAGFQPNVKKALLLGMGGGSLIETLRLHFGYQGLITCVEIDPVVIQIARKEFQIERFAPLHIICEDAATYVNHASQYFEWIIIDVFLGDKVPEALTMPDFLQHITRLLPQNGKMLFNTMDETFPADRLAAMEAYLQQQALKTRILRRVENTNNLLLATK